MWKNTVAKNDGFFFYLNKVIFWLHCEIYYLRCKNNFAKGRRQSETNLNIFMWAFKRKF